MSRVRLKDWRVPAGAAPAGMDALLAAEARTRRARRTRVAGTLGLFAVVIAAGALLGWRRAEAQGRAEQARLLDYHLESLRPGAR